jgi:hypothetical protein
MCGKKLVSNLRSYLEPLVDIQVLPFDVNQIRTLPCIVVGYESEEGSILSARGHYTVSGYAKVCYQGYDDETNTDADSTADDVIEALCDSTAIYNSLNKPLSGTDSRPLTGFGMHKLIVRGTSRDDEDHSTTIDIKFDAFCVAKDL